METEGSYEIMVGKKGIHVSSLRFTIYNPSYCKLTHSSRFNYSSYSSYSSKQCNIRLSNIFIKFIIHK